MAKNDPTPDAPKKDAPKAPDPKEAMKALRAKLVDPEQQTKCVYVDADGVEYAARILPVAINKGTLCDIPGVSDVAGEFQKIAAMRIELQVAALADLHARMNKTIKALSINNEVRILAEYKNELYYTTDWNGQKAPCADLMVEFSKKEGQSNRKCLTRVLPKEFVGVAPKGKRGRPHFYIA